MLIAALILAALTPARQFATESVDRLLESADPESGMSRFVGYPAQASKDVFVPGGIRVRPLCIRPLCICQSVYVVDA